MIISADTNVANTNMQLEKKAFQVKDLSKLLHLLTNMYSNPIRTLTQEYLCNARDAHRESNQTRKIDVYVPTAFSPVLKIRDYGPGLSPERIEEVFLYYGSSTKGSSNNETGGFGIGGKSAWAYTDSYTITAYVDGIKRVYAAIKSGGSPTLSLIEEVAADEPNGTCIEIAVATKDRQSFQDAVTRCIEYWTDAERPIVHGMECTVPNIVRTDRLGCSDDWSNLVIVDGIQYPMPRGLDLDAWNRRIRRGCKVFLDTGDVSIAPNREELIADDATVSKIQDTVRMNVAKLVAKLIAPVRAASTLKDYLHEQRKAEHIANLEFNWGKYTRSGNGRYLQYKQKDITEIEKFKTNGGSIRNSEVLMRAGLRRRLSYNPSEPSRITTKRCRTYMDKHACNTVYLVDENHPVAKDLELESLSNYEPAKNAARGKRVRGKGFTVRRYLSDVKTKDELLSRHPDGVIYASLKDRENLRQHMADFKNLYCMSKEGIKEIEGNPLFTEWSIFADSLTLSAKQVKALKRQAFLNNSKVLRYLDSGKVTALYGLIPTVETDVGVPYVLQKRWHDDEGEKFAAEMQKLEQKLLDKCPLLTKVVTSQLHSKEVTEYINDRIKGELK